MLGDVLLITEKHQKAGEIIIEQILANQKPKMMIGISGESGSGKSELAHVIAKGLRKHGIFAKPIHIDNYYPTANTTGIPLTVILPSLKPAKYPPDRV